MEPKYYPDNLFPEGYYYSVRLENWEKLTVKKIDW